MVPALFKKMKNRLKILGYKPATLKHDSNGWYIQYYAFSPVTNKLERVRTKLNCVRDNFRRLNDFRAYAEKMVQDINLKLAGGWSPLIEQQNASLLQGDPSFLISRNARLFCIDAVTERMALVYSSSTNSSSGRW